MVACGLPAMTGIEKKGLSIGITTALGRPTASHLRPLTMLMCLFALGCGARTSLEVRGTDAGVSVDASAPVDAAPPPTDAFVPTDAAPPIDAEPPPNDALVPVDASESGCLIDPGLCDDGDACTSDDCLADGQCANVTVTCDDGNACTVDSCDPTLGCLAEALDCDDDNVCTVDSCDPARGCVLDAVSCDDGNACTIDSCDPALGCMTTALDCDDNNLCTDDACDPSRGCVREAVSCNDADPCTRDACEPSTGCVFEPTDCRGCADGSRDAFRDTDRYPDIAGCAGGFAIAGLSRELDPACARGAGDDGANLTGEGCTAADLCAPGWHVCRTASEVQARSPDGCEGANDAAPGSFFATRQTGPGCAHCATGTDESCNNSSCRPGCAQTQNTTNDIFGCGTLGDVPVASSCQVLTRFSNNLCSALTPPWRCDDDPAGLRESDFVVKRGSAAGGVLCCPDE